MYIKKPINEEEKTLKIAIPLTKGTHKTRIKKRSTLNEYGHPVATKQEKFSQECYVEWQIGYDVVKNTDKIELTTIKNLSFTGVNNKEKCLYELSEYIYYFYEWKIIKKQELLNIKTFLAGLSENNLIEHNENYSIIRSHPVVREVGNIEFSFSQVKYPLLIHKFENYEIIVEIIIKEKQYAIGIQPMLYFCFPIMNLESISPLIGRKAETKEEAVFIINSKNINIFIQMLKIFGILSKNHRKDVLSIIDLIIK